MKMQPPDDHTDSERASLHALVLCCHGQEGVRDLISVKRLEQIPPAGCGVGGELMDGVASRKPVTVSPKGLCSSTHTAAGTA